MAAPPDFALSQESHTTTALAPRLARFVVTVVFVGFAVNALQYVLTDGFAAARVLPAAAVLGLMMYIQLGLFSNPAARLRGPRAYAALAAQAVLVFAPMAFYGEAWTGMPGFLAGDALLVLRPAAGWAAFAAIAVVTGCLQYTMRPDWLVGFYITDLAVIVGLVVYGLSRLRSLVSELDDARSDLAGLAVARERLRFARDLHDLLGFSLSAITLKTELTHRLVGLQPPRARRELIEIIGISRQALTDVRAVASSYRELSLDDELANAQSVLAAAEVVVTLAGEPGDLPAAARTVLATVVREGVTNLLRHSKAENCAITIARDERTITLEIVNDGVRQDSDSDDVRADHGNGIDNLTTRVEALGGELIAAPGEDDTYRLRATVPLAADRIPPPAEKTPTEPGPAMAPRLGFAITAAVFTGHSINALLFVFVGKLGVIGIVTSVACVLASLALTLGFFSRPNAPVRSPLGYAAWGALAVVNFMPVVLFKDPYLGLPGYVAGTALLVMPARLGVPVFLAVMTAAGGAQWWLGGTTIGIGYGFLVTINHGLVVFGLSRLRSMVQDLHDARSELADLAVTSERLRFARDLNDLLGQSLSAITLRSELTLRVLAKDPGQAQQELTAILDVSRRALADVRAVASSYRRLSLDEETVSARALLAAANINVTVRLASGDLPPEVRTALATVLREGVTNLLRHSKAENCEITLARREGLLTMEIVNDGVDRAKANGTDAGAGIEGLEERVRTVGGTLRAGTADGNTYRLRAEIPL